MAGTPASYASPDVTINYSELNDWTAAKVLLLAGILLSAIHVYTWLVVPAQFLTGILIRSAK